MNIIRPIRSSLSLRGAQRKAQIAKEPVNVGDAAPDFELVDHEGNKQKLSSFRGRRVLLSFHRFAACPICIYSVDRLRQQASIFERSGVVAMSIYKSTPQNIANVNSKGGEGGEGEDCFVFLSDEGGAVFDAFTVRKSTAAAVLGTVHVAKNRKKYKQLGFLDLSAMWKETGGGTNTDLVRQLPADFMIDENGVIVDLFRAERMTDHMPLERVEAFIPEEKRCQCNSKDCLFPTCRETHEEIQKEWASMCGGHTEAQ